MKSASQIHRLGSELDVIVGPIALRFSGFKEALPAAVRDTFTPWQRALPDVTIIHRASISLGKTRQRHFSLEIEDHQLDVAKHTSAWQLAGPATDSQADWIRWIDCALEPCAKLLLRRSVVSFCTVQHSRWMGGLDRAWPSGRGKSTLFNLMGRVRRWAPPRR